MPALEADQGLLGLAWRKPLVLANQANLQLKVFEPFRGENALEGPHCRQGLEFAFAVHRPSLWFMGPG